MKKLLFQKVVCLILSVTTLFGVVAFSSSAATSEGSPYQYDSNRDTASSLEDMKELVGIPTYEEYLAECDMLAASSSSANMKTVKINIREFLDGSTGVIVKDSKAYIDARQEDPLNWVNFTDKDAEDSVYLPPNGATTWNFHIDSDAAGYYYIKINYFSCITDESSISNIERELRIDGTPAFKEGSHFTLDKMWGYSNVETTEPVKVDEPAGVKTEYKQGKDAYCKVVTVVDDNGYKTVTTYTLSQDINGNSMAPGIQQAPTWNTYFCQDSSGYYNGFSDGYDAYFRFYLSEGNHQLSFDAVREPVIIRDIELVPFNSELNAIPTYEQFRAEHDFDNKTAADGEIVMIQAEFPDYVSDASVYPSNDKTSIATYPTASNALLYNVLGKNSYDSLGQWAAYKFRVTETGLYKMSMRYLQSALQGMYLCRAIRLSGGIYGLAEDRETAAVPFKEAYDIQFSYNKNWQSTFACDSNGTEFEFYFEAGEEYTLYVDCSLGSLQSLIQRAENVLNEVNANYLRLLQLTGAAPDEYRDYGFLEVMPDVLISFGKQAVELESIRTELRDKCGTNGSHIATLGTIALLLDEMSRDDGYNIAGNMSNLKTYLGTLGTWINDSKKGKLLLDSIAILPADSTEKDLPAANANFFKSAWYEITSFIFSFFTDYDKMGITESKMNSDVSIDVWLAMGRDQSNIWRTMIDAQEEAGGFTATTGYAVNLKLVTGGTLLPSILSGKGPDVYMGLGAADVINYAIRDAILGVSGNVPIEGYDNEAFNNTYYTYDGNGEPTTEYRENEKITFTSHTFKDYVYGNEEKDVNQNFVQAAMDTVTLLDVSYALPQTMAFSMMFYRMDVLAQLGLEVPETWDDLLSMLPVFQSNNMAIGVTYILALDFMLYQKGGNMWKYTEIPEYAGSKINLDSDIALESFEYVCRLFSDYSFPISFDAANRFRTGEMPLMIGSYEDFYNKIIVYATEIEGLWEFCPLPGIANYDEKGNRTSINYDSLASVTASVMLHGCEGKERLAAWEYMQWQTSRSVQAEYGNKLVSILGPSAKYETANINAIQDLSWTASERAAILDQIKHMKSIVNFPGSYIYGRYLKFAFLDAVNDGADPVDALSGYIDAINAEITRKREEFNLKTGDPS